ncbi:hypothetical protein DFH07DRAFT_241000 [Mycena maculata]|uniref:Glycosyltransferase family 18 catalytic domain-containing protein n=1 Tax=Mycena maculata TaxID=230809 RepID=A0AAD7JVC2_9AGAR|nr:hypothetical protein DFH07DRAFT_241000 [Mycena maculata]
MFNRREHSRPLQMRRIVRFALCVLALSVGVVLFSARIPFLSHRATEFTSITEPSSWPAAPANMDILLPTLYPSQSRTWITENQKTTHALFRCIEQSNCGRNQTKVVIIVAFEFIGTMEGGSIGGEAIWALSTLRALSNLGYSVLFAPTMDRAVQLYHIFHELVRVVIAHPEQATECWWNGSCRRTKDNPSGIPAWKIFSFSFWQQPDNPLGEKWTLSPEDYRPPKPNTYLGYSIEAQCHRHPFVPHSERSQQAYILAKELFFFHPSGRAWPPEFFDLASESTGVAILAGAKDSPGAPVQASPSDLAPSIKNLGPMEQDEFYDVLSRSVVLIGMGDPVLSPTPYDALCLGVPFINPIKEWDRQNPSDRNNWDTQHDMLKHLSPPYVYHVFKDDRDGFVQAIRDAQAHPIESFVLDRMKMEAVEYRLGRILEHNWWAEAAALLQEQKTTIDEPMFIL